ncbi:ABC transporter substrate-binding protein, partial [Patescibacteria group bacterium]|nr:ABC transporter substrate-binding protein [Patescibacteria group bacterium]
MPREETLYVAGHQWGAPTNFNPLSGNPAWPCSDTNETVYETLFGYNQVTDKLDPILADKYQWVDPYTLKVTLHQGTRWQDGTSLTTEDVVYTFELSKKYSLAYSDFWTYATGIKALDNRTVEINLNPAKPNRLIIMEQLGTVRILPKHIWINVEENYRSVIEFKNEKPVGSGPLKLLYFSPEKIILQRDDNYWGIRYFGKPAPKYVVHPIFKSNDAGNIAFEKAQIDLSQQFCPTIWKIWEKGLPVSTWYKHPPYHIPGSIPTLYINIHKYPLSLPEVRRALAYAINYEKIAEIAMTRYSVTVSPSMLILPLENSYYDETIVAKYGWTYNPSKSIEILKGLG